MNLVTDTHYNENCATTAGILFADWSSDDTAATHITTFSPVTPYEPGAFYKRELPCILNLLDRLDQSPDLIIIDGFVTLGPKFAPGLGQHLFEALGASTPIIGVAKSAFRNTPPETALTRGQSLTPLFVTSAGIPLKEAKDHIRDMHGPFRLPTLLAQVDRLCRAPETLPLSNGTAHASQI